MIQTNLAPPAITNYLPRLSGQDNEGIGHTRHGERYLLKITGAVCVAEFIGALLCLACGVPSASPTIVEFKGRKVFGSRLESGVELPTNVDSLMDQIAVCTNPTVFSAVLAIDLILGNGDRHWHNWLPQRQVDGTVILRAVDFSRAWPTDHPPLPLRALREENTGQVWREWQSLGISYDEDSALDVCDALQALDFNWLDKTFRQLPVEWMVSASGPELVLWWKNCWRSRVTEVRDFLKAGVWA